MFGRKQNQDSDPLSKAVWTDDDFSQMGWHDATLWSWKYSSKTKELKLDIDYIVRWIEPKLLSGYFQFVVAPATLIFFGASQPGATLEKNRGELIEILDLEKNGDNYKLIHMPVGFGDERNTEFTAAGYKQVFREAPRHTGTRTSIGRNKLHPTSFDITPYK
jgi:hypothetical protein